jgi:hypothetical protein
MLALSARTLRSIGVDARRDIMAPNFRLPDHESSVISSGVAGVCLLRRNQNRPTREQRLRRTAVTR